MSIRKNWSSGILSEAGVKGTMLTVCPSEIAVSIIQVYLAFLKVLSLIWLLENQY